MGRWVMAAACAAAVTWVASAQAQPRNPLLDAQIKAADAEKRAEAAEHARKEAERRARENELRLDTLRAQADAAREQAQAALTQAQAAQAQAMTAQNQLQELINLRQRDEAQAEARRKRIAQEDEASGGSGAEAMPAGALLFGMGSVFASVPGLFDSVGLGGRFRLDDNSQLRAGFGFNWARSESEADFGFDETNKQKSTNRGVAFEAGAEYYIVRADPLHLYAGGILQYAWAASDSNTTDVEITVNGVTAAAVLGVSFFFTDSVSLGAEYRLGVQYNKSESKRIDQDDDETLTTSTTDTRFGVGSVAFTLGFWFD